MNVSDVEPGRRDLAGRRRRRRAARTSSRPIALSPSTTQPPAAVVLGEHRAATSGSPLDERHERGVLGDRRRGHDPVLVDLDDALEDRRRAPPASRPASRSSRRPSRSRPSGSSARACPGSDAERAVAVRAVGEAVVDLVAVDEQVVALGDRGELVLDRVRQHGAGRVARVAEEQRLRARRDRRLDGRRVEREVVLEPGRRRGPAVPPANTIAGT